MRPDDPPPAARLTAAPTPARRLRLDATACAGIGMCAYLAPETLALDAWGFPVIRPHDLTGRRLRAARAAAAACPKRALHLGHSEPSTGR